MAHGNAKALVNALGNMLTEMDAERLIETFVKVKAEAVVGVFADRLVVVVPRTLTKDWPT